MKKIALIFTICLLILCSCTQKADEEQLSDNVVKPDFVKEELDEKFGTDEVYIVKTYLESPADEVEEYLDKGDIFTKVKHYLLSDGSWKTDEHTYKYKLELTGRMNNAARDSTYVILSNSDDITFDQAWKAFGYSSNTEDYFNPADAIIVSFA